MRRSNIMSYHPALQIWFSGCAARSSSPARTTMTNSHSANLEQATRALDAFQIEIPSWGFANTGTRFGKFVQAGAASTLEEKFSDAAEVCA
jgi:L-rhamnose isomerase